LLTLSKALFDFIFLLLNYFYHSDRILSDKNLLFIAFFIRFTTDQNQRSLSHYSQVMFESTCTSKKSSFDLLRQAK